MATSEASLPLRTVSQLTGLSADILRAWEKRYQVVSPRRGPRGARLYSRDDVAHLRLLAGVVSSGRSIGDVARLDRGSLQRLAGEIEERPATAPSDASADVVNRALDAIESFDAERFHRLLSDALLGLGALGFVQRVAAPLLAVIGDKWSRGELSIADEHLVSGSLRGLLSSLLHTRGRGRGPRLMLSTPSGERHEFGVLITALIAADAGLDIVYLGPELPAGEIIEAAERCEARVVALGIVNSANRDAAISEIKLVASKLPIATELWLGGSEAEVVAAAVNISALKTLKNFDAARAEVVRLCAQPARAF